MANKSKQETQNITEEKKDIFQVWADNYNGFLKMWGDSHLNLYKPWVESMGELSDKFASISEDSVPEKYKEFYDNWMETYKKTFGKYYSLPTPKSNKEILEKLVSSAEKSNKLYRSMIEELEENSNKTRELLLNEQDSTKYKECYNMWMKSYEKMFDEYLVEPAVEGTKEIFGNYPGIPEVYSDTHKHMSRLWKDSYDRLYMPMVESMLELSDKISEISKGNASPGAYKDFYNMWATTYKENFGALFENNSGKFSKETFEHFLHSTTIYLDMYRSWITALEKMSEKSLEISSFGDPDAYREFCDLWIKMYQKAFESFFEDMPMVGPMKETMEPVKVAAKTYSDTFVEMSRLWMNQSFNPGNRN